MVCFFSVVLDYVLTDFTNQAAEFVIIWPKSGNPWLLCEPNVLAYHKPHLRSQGKIVR